MMQTYALNAMDEISIFGDEDATDEVTAEAVGSFRGMASRYSIESKQWC